MSPVRWGVLSTGSIAREMVEAARRSGAARFVAVASRGGDRARQFAGDLDLELAFSSYQALLECDDVDAIYVALPISMHIEWTIKALRAGKHVLCEKPFAVSPEEARRAFDGAADARRVCAEALMYRYHPQTLLARRLVEQGSIGTLTCIRSALSVTVAGDDIRRDRALGGGAYLDLGCYCMSASRLFGATRSASTRRRCATRTGWTRAWRRPCGSGTMCWPSLTWDSISRGGTSWRSSEPRAGSWCPTRGSAAGKRRWW
jgi:D-xylose 1-dehydrogenase (NADP+, D-xylono-1,5-lactone-forming)